MDSVNRIGFTELVRPGAGSRTSIGIEPAGDGSGKGVESQRVNIVFVHGLRGHPYDTWTATATSTGNTSYKNDDRRTSRPPSRVRSLFRSSTPTPTSTQQERVFWPRDYLAEDIPHARVWTYGYDADVIAGLFRASGKDSVSQHGRNLAIRLERELEDENPLIFIAHSLGGILVKDAIWRSEKVRERTRLVIFLGTPHRGSGRAGWGQIASNLAALALQDSHRKIVDTLEVDNEVLDNIHEQFILAISDRNIRIHSFREAQGISGIKGLSGKIVDDFSSKLDQPKLETVESINANHMQMARCRHRSDDGYRAITGVIKQFLKIMDSQASIALTSQPQSGAPPTTQQGTSTPPPTTVYCNLPARNRRFVGRSEKLGELEARLIGSGDCQKLALVGLGGVGKTQVALRLAYTVKDRLPDCSIFWVLAVSEESFEQSYRAIARDCSIELSSTEEDSKETVRRFLSRKAAGRWLMIVDNADDEEILFGTKEDCLGIADYLPTSEQGVTLITTRYRQVATSIAQGDVVNLESMTYTEAENMLKKSLCSQELLQDRAATIELLTELTYLPLAITQAVAYINTMQVSFREYLFLLRNTEQDTISLLSREFRDETRSKSSKNAIATTWLISFDHIRRSDRLAADLLSFISCIEHKAIPRSLLPEAESIEQTVHALATLRAYAFVMPAENGQYYDMHRLVHLATKIWIKAQAKTKDSYERAIVHLGKLTPTNGYNNRVTWLEYLPHVFRLLENSRGSDLEARYDLCLWTGDCLNVDGRYQEAVSWLLECQQWRQKHLPETHPHRLVSQHRLAIAYLGDGQAKKAINLLEQVVTTRQAVSKEENAERLDSQQTLAAAYKDDHQTEKAVSLLEQVVTTRQATLKEDHPNRLQSQGLLALAYLTDGQIKKALSLIEQVVTIRQATLKEDHPDRLAAQYVLARVYVADGQTRKAISLSEQIIAVEQKLFRVDHPDLLWSQYQLATAYLANGQTKEAISAIEQVVTTRQAILKEDHPALLTSQHELAMAYLADGQTRKAISLFRRISIIQQEVYSEDDRYRLTSKHGLAIAYYRIGEKSKAIELLEQVIQLQSTSLAEDHPDRLNLEGWRSYMLSNMQAEPDPDGEKTPRELANSLTPGEQQVTLSQRIRKTIRRERAPSTETAGN